ncbi:hypothetical protein CPB85DRAFT_1452827 [Mucidula mucida]|nr:hypothetical protein CPB85DRAFT_1452827 [Mucidula mucida]
MAMWNGAGWFVPLSGGVPLSALLGRKEALMEHYYPPGREMFHYPASGILPSVQPAFGVASESGTAENHLDLVYFPTPDKYSRLCGTSQFPQLLQSLVSLVAIVGSYGSKEEEETAHSGSKGIVNVKQASRTLNLLCFYGGRFFGYRIRDSSDDAGFDAKHTRSSNLVEHLVLRLLTNLRAIIVDQSAGGPTGN